MGMELFLAITVGGWVAFWLFCVFAIDDSHMGEGY
jgi:hypothetical protein